MFSSRTFMGLFHIYIFDSFRFFSWYNVWTVDPVFFFPDHYPFVPPSFIFFCWFDMLNVLNLHKYLNLFLDLKSYLICLSYVFATLLWDFTIWICFFFFIKYFWILLSFKYSFLPFPPTSLYYPSHPHLPPLFPPRLVSVHVSFIVVPVNLYVSVFGSTCPPVPSSHCFSLTEFSWLLK